MESDFMSQVIELVVTYKWWIAALVPFVIVIMVLRARG